MSSSAEHSLFSLPGYDIQEKLGEGGMGVVFKARDNKLERQVAIKFLYQDSQARKDTNQVLQEARRLAQVNHPNVVSIYELCETQTETDSRSAIVMEYLSGTPLSDIQKEQLLSQNQKLSYLIQIAQGMVAIHDAGLRHGDLKAENVWITNDNKVKLLDFGLSAEVDSQPSESASTATSSASLTTLSPEFCRGQQLTQQTDIFNFGSLACRLLTDKLPFATDSLEACQNALRNDKITKVSELSPALSGALAQLLDHCLMAAPEKRPASFAQLLKQLLAIEEALQQQQLANNATMPFEPVAPAEQAASVTQATAPATQATASPAKRNKLLAVMASIALLISVSVFVWNQSNQPPPEKSVLVFPAKMTGEAQLPPEQTRMIKAALDNTLRDSVINTQSLNLISRSELDSVADDLNSSLKATGASNALQPLVDCQGSSCQITIELINGTSALIENQVRWHSPALDVYEISTIAQSYFQQLFPDYPVTDDDVIPVSKEAYEEFARLYAELHFNAGNTELHLEELGELLTKNPYLIAGYRLYRLIALRSYYDSGDGNYLIDVETVLSNAPREYRESAQYTLDLILLRIGQARLEEVPALLEIALSRGMNNISFLELSGIFQLHNGDATRAKELFLSALDVRFSTITLYNLALTYWYLGEVKEGISGLNELVKISPNYFKAHQLLASMYLFVGDLDNAAMQFEKVIKTSSESSNLNNLGLVYLLNGNFEKAEQYIRKAYDESPESYAILLNLADIENLLGRKKSAQLKYQNLVSQLQGKKDLDSLLLRAQAHVHLGMNLPATKALNEALKLSPDNSEVTFIASLIYTLTMQHPLAIVKVEETLENGHGDVWYRLPWFEPLCKYTEFRSLFSENESSEKHPCKI